MKLNNFKGEICSVRNQLEIIHALEGVKLTFCFNLETIHSFKHPDTLQVKIVNKINPVKILQFYIKFREAREGIYRF